MSEAARVIYSKLIDDKAHEGEKKQIQKYLAKTLLRLGDHSMETGKFDQSVEDYEKCLELRKEVFGEEARELADVNATLANAYLYSASEDQDAASGRYKMLKASCCYADAGTTLLLLRQKLLDSNVSLTLETSLETPEKPEANAETEEKEDTTEAAKEEEEEEESDSKGKAKKAKEEEAPALGEKEVKVLDSVKARFKEIETLVEKAEAKDDAKEAKELGELIAHLKEKVDDVILVLENKEASDAVTKGAQLVEEALEEASKASNPFDKPTLEQGEGEASNAAPTNLLQARKKASSPEDIAMEMEEATKEADAAEKQLDNKTPAVDASVVSKKRKASDIADAEVQNAKKVKA